jgi:hypothetical protein
MAIHTIGDSHSVNGWTKIQNHQVVNHHIGPILCYSFGMNPNIININEFNINNNDSIVFCFGEIDCRCHIHKYINILPYEKIIDNIIDNYFRSIQYNLSKLNISIKNICVYNVLPPIERYNTWENPEFPFLGNDEERKNYALYFNKKIKEKCNENRYIFFDVYNNYIDERGFLRKELSDNNVHIGMDHGIHINNFINNYL